MIVGSVSGGVLMGLTGAIITWVIGHPPSTIFVTYALVGSLGTLCVAAIAGRREADVQ